MRDPPIELGGARVLRYAVVTAEHTPTGNTRHTIAGRPFGPAAALAICRYRDEASVYLFYCDASWSVKTDTWHESVEHAMEQAAFEYEGISAAWKTLAD